MSEIVMPRLSDTMEEGTILHWLKTDGEHVARGEELAEIETDKATMTYESDQEGVLEILVAEGATLAVGEPIARVGASPDGAAAPGQQTPAADAQREASGATQDHAAGPDAGAESSGERPRGSDADVQEDERVRASPLARRIARDSELDLRSLSGSGPGGRIVKSDVLAAAGSARRAPAGEPAAATTTASSEVATAKGRTSEVELTRTQQTIARRMAESKATIPDFALRIDVDMQECVELRAELKRMFHGEGGEQPASASPTYNDMVVKACALALREYERANASYRDGRVQLHSRINVGVAVAADGALIVPTVFDADEKSLGEIAREARALAERVRAQTITPPQLGGATFTVSNLGMYGIASFTPIINPPQAAILSVGALEQRAVVRDGSVIARASMTLTLVCDHRILYGAEAAQFLARVRELLETPSALTL